MGGPPGMVPSPRASACTLSSDGGGRPLPAVRGARAGTPRCWQRPAQGPPGLPGRVHCGRLVHPEAHGGAGQVSCPLPGGADPALSCPVSSAPALGIVAGEGVGAGKGPPCGRPQGCPEGGSVPGTMSQGLGWRAAGLGPAQGRRVARSTCPGQRLPGRVGHSLAGNRKHSK